MYSFETCMYPEVRGQGHRGQRNVQNHLANVQLKYTCGISKAKTSMYLFEVIKV